MKERFSSNDDDDWLAQARGMIDQTPLDLSAHTRADLEAFIQRQRMEQIALRLKYEDMQGRQRQFRGMFENSALGMAICDLQGNIFEANAGLAAITGYSVDELIGMNFGVFTHPDDLPAEHQLLHQLLVGEIPVYTYEKRYVRATDAVIHVRVNCSLLRDEAGKPTHTLALVENIEESWAAQQALKNSSYLYEAVVANLPNGSVALYDMDRRYVLIGGSNLGRTGYTPEDFIGKRIGDLFPPEVAAHDALLQRTLEHGETITAELEFGGRMNELHMMPIVDEGEVVAGVILAQDVTERVRATTLIQTILDSTEHGFILLDKDRTILTFNRVANEITQRDYGDDLREGASIMAYIKLLPEASQQSFARHFTQALDGKCIHTEREFADHWQRYIYYPVHAADGTVTQVSLTIENIQERVLAEKAQAASERRFEHMLDLLPVSIAVIDSDTLEVLYANAARRRLPLYSSKSDDGEQILDEYLLSDEMRADNLERIQRAQAGEVLEPMEMRWRLPDGSERRVIAQAMPLMFQGRPAIMTIMQDVTEHYQRLERERMTLLQNFVLYTSHEFRTLLQGINMATHMVSRTGVTDRGRVYLKRIDGLVDTIVSLVDDLLLMSRLDSGQLQLEIGTFKVAALCQSIMDKIMATTEKQVTLYIDTEDAPLYWPGDGDYLARALFELVDNAVHHTDVSVTIVTRAGLDGTDPAELRITVKDNGPGIPIEEHERIFEHFYRLDEAHTTRGFGLGLTIARGIVAAHGGRITVESAPGKGCAFTLILPGDRA